MEEKKFLRLVKGRKGFDELKKSIIKVWKDKRLQSPSQKTTNNCPLCVINDKLINKFLFWKEIDEEELGELLGVGISRKVYLTHKQQHLYIKIEENEEEVKERNEKLIFYKTTNVSEEDLVDGMIGLLKNDLMKLKELGLGEGEEYERLNEMMLKWMKLKREKELDKKVEKGDLSVLLRKLLEGGD